MENRSKVITEFGNKLLELPFSEHLIEIKKDLSRPDSLIIHGLLEQCDRLFQQAAERQKNGDNEQFAVMMFAVSKVSDVNITPEIRLFLHTKDFYIEDDPVMVKWKAKLIYQYIENDYKKFINTARYKFSKLDETEIQDFILQYLEQYHTAVYIVLKQSISKIMSQTSFDTFAKTNDFSILFGQCQQEGYQLYPNPEGE